MTRTVLAGGTVVTVDPDRRVLDPGAVAVDGDAIEAVGPREEVLAAHPDAERIDLDDHVLLPGLVDSHGHAGHGLTKNFAEGTGDWLDDVRDVYFRAMTEADWRAEGRLGALERLRAGVTTSLSYLGSAPRVDDPKFAEAAAAGYREFGLRHVVAVGPPDRLPVRCVDPDTGAETVVDLDHAMETTRTVVDRLDGSADGRLSVAVAPSRLVAELDEEGRATDHAVDKLRRVTDLAESRDLPLHAHTYEGHVAAAAEAHPEALSPRLSLAHCCGTTESELDLLAEHDVATSHSPLAHAYARQRFPVVEAMERGVTVAVSTDGIAPDRSFDLLSQGRVAAQLQRAHHGDDRLLPAGRTLQAMTVDAADALGLADEVGSLERGKRADVVAVDRRGATVAPHLSAGQVVPRLVHYADGSDVSFVMVDGDVRVRDGTIHAPEAPAPGAVIDDAERAGRRAIERAGHEAHLDPHPDLWDAVRYTN